MQSKEKEDKIWHAIYCKPRQEKKVSKLFELKDIEHYLPLLKVKKKWSDRIKVVEEPLLRSYVFIPSEIYNNQNVKTIDGVLNYVYSNGKVAVIYDYEINRIKDFLGELIVTEEQYKKISLGSTVEIIRGAFAGQKGEVIDESKKTIQLKIESLGYELNLKVDKGNIVII